MPKCEYIDVVVNGFKELRPIWVEFKEEHKMFENGDEVRIACNDSTKYFFIEELSINDKKNIPKEGAYLIKDKYGKKKIVYKDSLILKKLKKK